jgi:hypothetical protein
VGGYAGPEANAARVLLARSEGGGRTPSAGHDDAGATKSPLSKEVSAGESDEDDGIVHEELAPELAAEAILKQGYLMKRGKSKTVRCVHCARARVCLSVCVCLCLCYSRQENEGLLRRRLLTLGAGGAGSTGSGGGWWYAGRK